VAYFQTGDLAQFQTGACNVDMGDVAGVPFFMGGAQYEYWAHTFLTVDVVKGRGSGFSVEAPHGVRFLIRSRLFTDDEAAAIDAEGPLPRGPRA
jgi:uncharacterized protein (DUF779 family)